MLKEEEAAAVSQVPPELEGQVDASGQIIEGSENEDISDGNEEGSNDGLFVEKKGLKRLFKQIVKNANSSEKVDVKKEYAPLMQKYIERTQTAKKLS